MGSKHMNLPSLYWSLSHLYQFYPVEFTHSQIRNVSCEKRPKLPKQWANWGCTLKINHVNPNRALTPNAQERHLSRNNESINCLGDPQKINLRLFWLIVYIKSSSSKNAKRSLVFLVLIQKIFNMRQLVWQKKLFKDLENENNSNSCSLTLWQRRPVENVVTLTLTAWVKTIDHIYCIYYYILYYQIYYFQLDFAPLNETKYIFDPNIKICKRSREETELYLCQIWLEKTIRDFNFV